MEKIVFVSRKHGRKTRHGYVDNIAGVSIAICPVKADSTVYFGIPGAHEDFFQVHHESWDGDKNTLAAVVANAAKKLGELVPRDWADKASALYLEEIRAKKKTAHKEYIKALLDEHLTYQGKNWK